MRRAAVLIFAAVALFAQTAPSREQITALSKTFLRDSAELPMDVAVTAVVTDAAGKQKRNAHSTVRFVFHGYNGETGRWNFRSNSGMFSMRILNESVGGSFAFIDAFARLTPQKDNPPLEVDGFSARTGPGDCKQFRMSKRFPYPEDFCYTTEYRLARDASGDLAIERFALDIHGLPAQATVPYLGDVRVLKIHSDGEVQQARMPDDPRPFLIPKRVTTTLETDRGKIVVTNTYTLRLGRK
jgi:hypothetical protein